jgi:hypothetical protein
MLRRAHVGQRHFDTDNKLTSEIAGDVWTAPLRQVLSLA